MMYKQGEIYYMETEITNTTYKKPVIIASSAHYNCNNLDVYIIPLAKEPRCMNEYMFKTWATISVSVGICENLKSVSKDRIGKKIGELSEVEKRSMKDCLAKLFMIDTELEHNEIKDTFDANEYQKISDERDKYRAEVDFYKRQYDELLTKLIDRK